MINNSFKIGMQFMLNMKSLESLFIFSPLHSTTEPYDSFMEMKAVYDKFVETPHFSNNIPVSKEALTQIAIAILGTNRVILATKNDELKKAKKNQNLIDSLELASTYLKQFGKVIEAAHKL